MKIFEMKIVETMLATDIVTNILKYESLKIGLRHQHPNPVTFENVTNFKSLIKCH